jgi:hypothetical protein
MNVCMRACTPHPCTHACMHAYVCMYGWMGGHCCPWKASSTCHIPPHTCMQMHAYAWNPSSTCHTHCTHACKCMHGWALWHSLPLETIIHMSHPHTRTHMLACICMDGHCGDRKPSSTCHIHTRTHTCMHMYGWALWRSETIIHMPHPHTHTRMHACMHAYVRMGIVAIGNHHPHATSTHTCMHAYDQCCAACPDPIPPGAT